MTNDATSDPLTCPLLAPGDRGDFVATDSYFATWHAWGPLAAGTYTWDFVSDSDNDLPGVLAILMATVHAQGTVGAGYLSGPAGEVDGVPGPPPPDPMVWDGTTDPFAFTAIDTTATYLGSTPGPGQIILDLPVTTWVYGTYGAFQAGGVVNGHIILADGAGPAGPVGVQRWAFRRLLDDDVTTLDYNPDESTSFNVQQITTTAPISPIDGLLRGFRSLPPPRDASFAGFIRTKAQHDRLIALSKETGKFEMTDHLGRTYFMRFISCDIDEKKPTKRTPWKLRYTMRCRTYGASS